jgi:hypothetical protein
MNSAVHNSRLEGGLSMTKLVWGTPGERFYESGVDRGVVYIDGTAYAWNGLLSVSEKSSGGDLQPYYLDGVKYAQLMSSEEFEATLEALSSPRQFGPCDGSKELYAGLTVTQQKRKTFNLSYRTKIGSDLSEDLGYKIHIVYNALAGPSERANATVTQSLDPIRLSWGITAIPAQVTGIRPSAHFVVDSTRANSTKLALLEDYMYGTNISVPFLPNPVDLVALFA